MDIKEKVPVSPGIYGLPESEIKSSEDKLANYNLTVIMTPGTYKWRIFGKELTWRANSSSKLLKRDQYFIEYSNVTVSAAGMVGYFLNADTILTIKCEE